MRKTPAVSGEPAHRTGCEQTTHHCTGGSRLIHKMIEPARMNIAKKLTKNA